MPRTRALVAIIGALVVAGCGGDDDTTSGAGGDDATRTVEIEMVDTAFEPATLEVERGETVRFVFTNSGTLVHDAFIGDAHAQADHEAEMRGDDTGHGDDHGGEADNAVTVDPGDDAELTYTFEESGSVEIGCHQPGHYGAGMKIDVTVL